MQHRAFAPALGALAAIFVAAGVPSYASAADPSGIWAKEDGSAKIEVKKCGRGICSKIVWLKNPEDRVGGRCETPATRIPPCGIGQSSASHCSSTW